MIKLLHLKLYHLNLVFNPITTIPFTKGGNYDVFHLFCELHIYCRLSLFSARALPELFGVMFFVRRRKSSFKEI